MVGDREFAQFLRFEAVLTSEDIMALASTYRRMPASYLDLGRMSVWRPSGATPPRPYRLTSSLGPDRRQLQRNKESQRRSREKRLKLEQTTLTGTFYQSSHIIEMQKNYCFKRNTINFSMADLENDSEDDDQVYENFEVDEIHLSKRLLPTRKCRE